VALTSFQRTKLARMFALLDLNGDGFVEQADYRRRVEAFAALRGWTSGAPERERNLAHALDEWESLRESADEDGDGRVSQAEFLRYGATFLDDRDAVRSYARGDVQLLFDAMDRDGDGRITVDEYREYLQVCGADAAAADGFFRYADVDGDGRMTRAEIAHAFEEFFLSTDPSAAGNLLFGPLDTGAAG
jgi:Ca2+-binding EF-hand superfamily protein